MFSYYVINTNEIETKSDNKYTAQLNTTGCGFPNKKYKVFAPIIGLPKLVV